MTTFLAGNKGRTNTRPTPDYQLRISTSVEGQPIPIFWGQARIAPNCVEYNWFNGYWTSTSSGKGGGGHGLKGGGGNSNGQWNYVAGVIWSICEGPVAQFVGAFENGTFYWFPFSSSVPVISAVGGWYGTDSQTPTLYGASLNYRGQVLASGTLQLGSSSSLPNISFIMRAAISYGVPALGPDAHPVDVIVDFLTNAQYGVPSWSSSWLASMADARTYCAALGLVVSPALTSPVAASQFLMDLSRAINCEFVWSGGQLDLKPYADHASSGNGVTYAPDLAPVYDLTIDDFQVNRGSLGGAPGDTPIAILIANQADQENHFRLEFLDAATQYNPRIVDAIDEGSIALHGIERRSDVFSGHMFTAWSAAKQSVSLMMARAKITRRFQFTIGSHFILLDPMDLVTLTEPQLGLYRQSVRIAEIQENDDGSLTVTADEFLGRVSSPLYGQQAAAGAILDRNADPGAINAPVIFEPPYELAQALELWIAVSGADTALYGGCNIWASNDDTSYEFVGSINGPSNMGVSTSALPSVAVAAAGPTVDTVNPLQVDFSESKAQLTTTTAADMLAGGSGLYVDGEIVSYQIATLTSANCYDLTPLRRGVFGSAIASHAAGSPVVRIDNGVFRLPITTDRIGKIVYFKFQPLNSWGGFRQQISDVGSVAYTIPGLALTGGLEAPQNPRVVFEDGFMKIWWDEVKDFRGPVRYNIRQGPTYASSTLIAPGIAHPPFVAFGEGNYWLEATISPLVGVDVVSAAATEITIAGNMLVANLLIEKDEQLLDWPGSTSNMTVVGPPGSKYITLDVGETQGSYTIPLADIPDLGYVGTTAINVSWQATGAPLNADFFEPTDFFAQADVFNASASAFVEAWPEIQISDLDPGSGGFGPWQKFVPGNYRGRSFNLRMQVRCVNPAVTAALNFFKFAVSVKPRIDHYMDQSIAPGGTTITFQPDGAAGPGAFNGGPNSAAAPLVNLSWPQSPNDVLSLSALSLSSVTVQILNGGVGVARTNVNILVEGY